MMRRTIPQISIKEMFLRKLTLFFTRLDRLHWERRMTHVFDRNVSQQLDRLRVAEETLKADDG